MCLFIALLSTSAGIVLSGSKSRFSDLAEALGHKSVKAVAARGGFEDLLNIVMQSLRGTSESVDPESDLMDSTGTSSGEARSASSAARRKRRQEALLARFSKMQATFAESGAAVASKENVGDVAKDATAVDVGGSYIRGECSLCMEPVELSETEVEDGKAAGALACVEVCGALSFGGCPVRFPQIRMCGHMMHLSCWRQ